MSDEIERVDAAPAGGRPASDTPAAGPLSAADLARVEELKNAVDVTDAQGILGYGLRSESVV